MNSVSNNAHASMRYTTYPDIYRKLGLYIILSIFACGLAFSSVIVVSAFREDLLFKTKAFFIVLSIFVAYAFSVIIVKTFPIYFVKTCFGENCILCLLFGKPIKKLNWNDIKNIVCVVCRRPGSTTYYLMFSSHELTEEEKRKSIELAGVKNDIVVVKCTKKNLKRIREIHDFSYVDESGRKNALKEFFDNLRS